MELIARHEQRDEQHRQRTLAALDARVSALNLRLLVVRANADQTDRLEAAAKALDVSLPLLADRLAHYADLRAFVIYGEVR